MRTLGIVIASLVLASAGQAMQGQQVVVRSGGWGAGSPLNKLWNAQTEITFSGRVTGIQKSQPFQGMDPGTALLVKNNVGGGTALVELGPGWYVDNQPLKFAIGDRVTVTGSKIFVDGRSSILARKVTKGNRVMYLRGTDGFPMWVAWRGHVTVTSAQSATPRTQLMTGEVVEIGNVVLQSNPLPSSYVVVRTAAGELVTVELGPRWFIDRQDVAFAVGETLVIDAVRGPATFNSSPVWVANSVRRGNEVLILRYQNGRPVWEAWGGG